VATFMAFESPIICLRWNPTNTLLLAISPESEGTVVTVMSPATQETVQTNMPRHSLAEQPLEAAWTSNEEFVVCGGDLLHAYHCSAAGISSVRKYETREGHALSKVVFDWPSRLLATASDTGMIDVSSNPLLTNSANTPADLGSPGPVQLVQCSPGPHHLSALATYAEPRGLER
jgi:transducin (beta)-like 1